MSETRTLNTHKTIFFDGPWRVPAPGEEWYTLPVYLMLESDGTFSVIAATLPGAASQGDTIEEALSNITEAITGSLLAYRESKTPYPWRKAAAPKAGWLKRYVHIELPPML